MLIKLILLFLVMSLSSTFTLNAADKFPTIRKFSEDRLISSTCDHEAFVIDPRKARDSVYASRLLRALFPAFTPAYHPRANLPVTDRLLKSSTVLSVSRGGTFYTLLRNRLAFGDSRELVLSHDDGEARGEAQIYLPSSDKIGEKITLIKEHLEGIIPGLNDLLKIAPLLTFVQRVGYVFLVEGPADENSAFTHYMLIANPEGKSLCLRPLFWDQPITGENARKLTSLSFLSPINQNQRYLSLIIIGGARNFAIFAPLTRDHTRPREISAMVIFHSADRTYNTYQSVGLHAYPRQGKFSANDKFFVLLFADGSMSLFKCVEGKWSASGGIIPSGIEVGISALAFSPGQTQLLIALKNQTMFLIDLNAYNKTTPLELTVKPKGIDDIFWREDGLITCVNKDGHNASVHTYTLDTRTETPRLLPYKIKNPGEVNSILEGSTITDFIAEPSGEGLWAVIEEMEMDDNVSERIRRIILPHSTSAENLPQDSTPTDAEPLR